MNREQFIAQLARLLQDLPPAERQEAIRYYQEYFDDAGEENEDAVIQELGYRYGKYRDRKSDEGRRWLAECRYAGTERSAADLAE